MKTKKIEQIIQDELNIAKTNIMVKIKDLSRIDKVEKFNKKFFKYLNKNSCKIYFSWERMKKAHITTDNGKAYVAKSVKIYESDKIWGTNKDAFKLCMDYLNKYPTSSFYIFELIPAATTYLNYLGEVDGKVKVEDVPSCSLILRCVKIEEEK